MSINLNEIPTDVEADLSRRYEDLLITGNHSDCTFLFGDTTLHYHKLILSTASPVFEAMLYGAMREDRIVIPDMSAPMFQKLAQYIYTGRIVLEADSLENLFELYYGAEKYLMRDLQLICLNAIKKKLRCNNILPALELSFHVNFKPLMGVCLNFLVRCCLGDSQFSCYLKSNYFHLSKDCVRALIGCGKHQKLLMWFIMEWCRHECELRGLEDTERERILKDLQLEKPGIYEEHQLVVPQVKYQTNTIDRCYYKACRPFVISGEDSIWEIEIQCDRSIKLLGLVIKSRLQPPLPTRCNPVLASEGEYRENFYIEIRTVPNNETDDIIVLQHHVNEDHVKYNCDFNVLWNKSVLFCPDRRYRVKLLWQENAYDAEYPCSLQSTEVDGFQFNDLTNHFGSPIKGLKYTNLIV